MGKRTLPHFTSLLQCRLTLSVVIFEHFLFQILIMFRHEFSAMGKGYNLSGFRDFELVRFTFNLDDFARY